MGACSPEDRRRVLAEIAADDRMRAMAAAAVPAPSGNLVRDLAAADDAVAGIGAAWEAADADLAAARADAGRYPTAEQWQRVRAAESRRAELWTLRQRAVRHRDNLAGEFGATLAWLAEPGDDDPDARWR